MKKTYFVTGTDTDAGKTLVSAAILFKAAQLGKSTLGLKPVAAGCHRENDGLKNADALMLQSYSTHTLSYAQINPIALEAPIAPHIAAAQENRRLSVSRIEGIMRGSISRSVDLTIIEGAGGWMVPLNATELISGVPKALQTPVVLVVGVRLGCINHALLTAAAIASDGLQLTGWVASIVDPQMQAIEENIDTLKSLIRAPCLGVVPYIENITVEQAAEHLVIERLFSQA